MSFFFRLENAKQAREALVERLKFATESTLSAEERAAQMDEMMAKEEHIQSELETELKRLRDLQFRTTQELHRAHTEERNTEAEIQVITCLTLVLLTCLLLFFHSFKTAIGNTISKMTKIFLFI